MTRSLNARLAGCAIAGALVTGLAAPAMAVNELRPADPPAPGPTVPTPPPNAPSDQNTGRYCQQDPDWYLCQHHHGNPR